MPNSPSMSQQRSLISGEVIRSGYNPHGGYEYRGAFRNKDAPRDLLYARRTEEDSEELQKIAKAAEITGQVNEDELLNDLINMKFGKEDKSGQNRNLKIAKSHRPKAKRQGRQTKF